MNNIECSFPAYKRIMDFGIYKKILDVKRTISNVFLYGYISNDQEDEDGEHNKDAEILNWAVDTHLDSKRGITQQSQRAKNILLLDQKLINSNKLSHENEKFFLQYSSFLTTLVLGTEKIDPSQYGFSSLNQLEKAVASFCIGNPELIKSYSDNYFWFNSKYKNEISLNLHGDFFVNQVNISDPEIEKRNLFERFIDFESVKEDPPGGGVSVWQDSSQFHLALLKYAQHLGQEKMHEIVDWREVLEETGSFGANTSEGFGGGSFYDHRMDDKIMVEGEKLKRFPLTIDGRYYGGEGAFYLPYITKENDLHFLKKYDEGSIEIDLGPQKMNFATSLKFTRKDLPFLLRGTHMLYTRDKSILPQVINAFSKNLKTK